MKVNEYLNRIGYSGSRKPDHANLRRLMLAHLRRVPFENLSIHIGERIKLDHAWLFEKIVGRSRGGFCYELNGLFFWLLTQLGYRVEMLSAGVRANGGDTDSFGPAFDHMVLKVELEDSWLVDVGFGRAFSEPLALKADAVQAQGSDRFRLTRNGETWTYWHQDGDWQAQYRFDLAPQPLHAFQSMCQHHQTSKESPFTRRWMVTHLAPKGRETLHQDGEIFRYITTVGEKRHEVIIHGLDNAVIILEEVFGIPSSTFDRPGRRRGG